MESNGGPYGDTTDQGDLGNSASSLAQSTITTENGTTVVEQISDTNQDINDFKTESKWEFTPLEKASYECADMYLEPAQQQQPEPIVEAIPEPITHHEFKTEPELLTTKDTKVEPNTNFTGSDAQDSTSEPVVEPTVSPKLEDVPAACQDSTTEPVSVVPDPEQTDQPKVELEEDLQQEQITDPYPETISMQVEESEVILEPLSDATLEQQKSQQQDSPDVGDDLKGEDIATLENTEQKPDVNEDLTVDSMLDQDLKVESVQQSDIESETKLEPVQVSIDESESQVKSDPHSDDQEPRESDQSQEMQQQESDVKDHLRSGENGASSDDAEETVPMETNDDKEQEEEEEASQTEIERPVTRPTRTSRVRQSSVRLQPIETVKQTRSTRKSRVATEDPCNESEKSGNKKPEEKTPGETTESEDKEKEPEAMPVEEPTKPSRVSRGRGSAKHQIPDLPKIKVDRRPSKRQMDNDIATDADDPPQSNVKTPTHRRSKIPKITLRPQNKPSTSNDSPEQTTSPQAERSSQSTSTKLSCYTSSDDRRTSSAYENDGIGRKYRCNQCGFSTDRLNNIVYHHKHLYLCKGGQKIHDAMVEQWKHSSEFAKGNKRRYMKQ